MSRGIVQETPNGKPRSLLSAGGIPSRIGLEVTLSAFQPTSPCSV
jgi:hypothetical protein